MDQTTEDSSNETYRAKAVIRNSAGIHCRPTAVIVKEARRFECEISVHTSNDTTADPKSAIELLALGLDEGTEIEIEANGDSAPACCQRLVELFETEFDFPPREDGRKREGDEGLMA